MFWASPLVVESCRGWADVMYAACDSVEQYIQPRSCGAKAEGGFRV